MALFEKILEAFVGGAEQHEQHASRYIAVSSFHWLCMAVGESGQVEMPEDVVNHLANVAGLLLTSIPDENVERMAHQTSILVQMCQLSYQIGHEHARAAAYEAALADREVQHAGSKQAEPEEDASNK